MQFYQEITLLPDSDISLGFVWQKLYQQVHIALVEHKIGENQSAVAVGFPEYGRNGFPLGSKLRLFSTQEEQLQTINMAAYLNRLSDYVHLKSIQPVPAANGFVCFTRHHVKGEARIEKDHQQKARRWSEKSGKPLAECLEELSKSRPKPSVDLPFIWMDSQETKRREGGLIRKFPLFIGKSELPEGHLGNINCYGLSYPGAGVALPVF